MQEASSTLWLRRGAAIVAAVLVAVLAYILFFSGDDNNSSGKTVIGGDAAKIQSLAGDQDHPVYWAGPEGAQTFEWTKTDDGQIYVRYLTGGAQINNQSPSFLTVGTYPSPSGDGIAEIKKAAKRPGAGTLKVKGGGTAVVNENLPTSVYVAFPGSKYQIEVFDPDPARALKLVTSGQIQPIP
jgi:hypothetical protein